MPNSSQEEKLRWITPILEKRMKIKDLALVCPFSERAIKYWLKQYREYGIAGLENKSTRPKSQPNETPIRIKERIVEIREEETLSKLSNTIMLRSEIGAYFLSRITYNTITNHSIWCSIFLV